VKEVGAVKKAIGPQDVQVPAAAEAAALLGVPARLPATAVQPVRPPVLLGLFLSAPLRQSINVAVASPDDVREERAGVLRVSTRWNARLPVALHPRGWEWTSVPALGDHAAGEESGALRRGRSVESGCDFR
jgi:hypothetical protein